MMRWLALAALALVCGAQQQGLAPSPEMRQQAEQQMQQQTLMQTNPAAPAQPAAPFFGQQNGPMVTGAGAPGPPPSYVTGMPQPYPMASPYSMGHIYGGYGVPVHPAFRALHAFIGAPPPPVIPYGAPYYPPYQ